MDEASIGTEDASIRAVSAFVCVSLHVEPAEHLLVGFGPALQAVLLVTVQHDNESEDGTKQTAIDAVASLAGGSDDRRIHLPSEVRRQYAQAERRRLRFTVGA